MPFSWPSFRMLSWPPQKPLAEPEPAKTETAPAPPLWIVIAYHTGDGEFFHGPFEHIDDAIKWAEVKLKYTATLGWDVLPLYALSEGALPAHRNRRAAIGR